LLLVALLATIGSGLQALSAAEPKLVPAAKSVTEPTAKPATEPASKSLSEPATEPAASQKSAKPEPVSKPKPKPATEPEPERPAIDFGRDVQPILARRCFNCHGPDRPKARLRLDQRDSILQELGSGARAVVPGNPDDSELLYRISSTEEGERMPPEGKPLTADEVATIRQWVVEGARWEEHWAFQPLSRPQPPVVKQADWCRNPIDQFIRNRLDQAGLSPAEPADKVTLLRRVTFDLTGLPPTPADVDRFLADKSPDAYEQLVDRLLASPRYGERWARHWLDLVRYADTNSFERDGVKPHAWRYRDYVIRSLNADKPYDRFIREQLAGDELPDADRDSLIATGYYRLGLWDDEPADRLQARYDSFDDIVATTGQVFLGLTINCARCHDHKLDPIPQRDYYSLVAFFEGLTPMAYNGPNIERPIFSSDQTRAEYAARVRNLEDRRNQTQAQITAVENQFRTQYEKRSAVEVSQLDLDDLEYRFYRDQWEHLPVFDDLKPETVGKLPLQLFDISPATRKTDFGFVFTGFLKVPQEGEYTFVLDSDDGSRLLVDGRKVVEYDGIHGTSRPRRAVVKLPQGRLPIRLEYFQRLHGLGLSVAWSGPTFGLRSLSAGTKTGTALADLIEAHGADVLGEQGYKDYQSLQEKLTALKKEKVPVDLALCVSEVGAQPPATHILLRGNAHVPGEEVGPAFPALFAAPPPVLPTPAADAKTSGRRLVLANWIAAPENRLTSRVLVNRIWQHHFGRGIVRSTNNFGQLGDRPTHAYLCDWLARQFVAGGWRLKPLHKLMVMSSTYRMSSQANSVALDKDPQNDLFWRFDMRRLSAEEVRDSIHFVNGSLNSKMYGPGIFPEISKEVLAGQSRPGQGWGKSSTAEQARRSIYIHVKRSLIVPLLADFDFAETDSSCAARFATTQPTQALGMLNGDFTNRQAGVFAERLQREAGNDPRAQVRLALQLALSRPPDSHSVDRGVALLRQLQSKHHIDESTALRYYCLVVLNLNEFVYLD